MKTFFLFLIWSVYYSYSLSQSVIEVFGNPKCNNFGQLEGSNIPNYFKQEKKSISYEFGISFRLLSFKNNSFFLGGNYSTNIYKQKIYSNQDSKTNDIIFRSSNQVSKFYPHLKYRVEKILCSQSMYFDIELGLNTAKTGGFQVNSKLYPVNSNGTVDTINIYRIPTNLKASPLLTKLELGTKIKLNKYSNLLIGLFFQFGKPNSQVNWIIVKNNIQEGDFYHIRSNISYGMSIKYQIELRKKNESAHNTQ
jgi:hypothetical protein